MQKIFNALSAISFVLVLGIGAGGILSYRWATNPKTHEKIKTEIIKSITKSVKMPSMTGGAAPAMKATDFIP
tara:strand:+ start:446 stop:661 length:216 start_codon:yes stop_codon:yes gene_type:complete